MGDAGKQNSQSNLPGIWLVIVEGDIEPYTKGPFKTDEERDEAAKEHRRGDPQKEDGIYTLDIDENGIPSIDAYSGGFFHED